MRARIELGIPKYPLVMLRGVYYVMMPLLCLLPWWNATYSFLLDRKRKKVEYSFNCYWKSRVMPNVLYYRTTCAGPKFLSDRDNRRGYRVDKLLPPRTDVTGFTMSLVSIYVYHMNVFVNPPRRSRSVFNSRPITVLYLFPLFDILIILCFYEIFETVFGRKLFASAMICYLPCCRKWNSLFLYIISLSFSLPLSLSLLFVDCLCMCL